MKTKMILACAGLAACGAQGQFDRTDALTAKSADGIYTPTAYRVITAIKTDGTHVYGPWKAYTAAQAAASTRAPADVYNSYGLGADTDGDGFRDPVCGDLCLGFSPDTRLVFTGAADDFSIQHQTDDAEFDAAAVDNATRQFDGVTFAGQNVGCTPGVGQEPYNPVFRMWNSVDLVADLDGLNDGFDNDGDGVAETPYAQTDTDGDGFIDQFVGGFEFSFNTVDTDGDGIGDLFNLQTGAGYGQFFANGLSDTDGDGMVDNATIAFPDADADGDGRPDGSIEVLHTQGAVDTDGDGVGDGPMLGGYFPSTRTGMAVYGTENFDTSTCSATNGIATGGSSEGIIWGQGENLCGDAGASWSDGATDGGTVNQIWDPSIDVSDFTGLHLGAGGNDCPTVSSWMIAIESDDLFDGGMPPRLCADQNNDGVVLPNDFSSWVINFNTMNLLADVNQDMMVLPNDFSAWVIAFNQGAAGPFCTP